MRRARATVHSRPGRIQRCRKLPIRPPAHAAAPGAPARRRVRGRRRRRARARPCPGTAARHGSRQPAEHGDDAAARLRPERAADHVLHRSRHPRRRSRLQRAAPGNTPIQRLWTGAPVVRRAGVERPGAVSRLERHPQQPAAAVARRRRARHRVPSAVEQQQRQHVRLPGPSALVRAPHAPASCATSTTDRSP